MDLVSAFLRLARLYPNDQIIHLDNQGDYLKFKTTHFEATLTVKAAEELANKFFELKVPRCSVYVGIVRFWLTQRNPDFFCLTPFHEWLGFPCPELEPNKGEERQLILTADRIIDGSQIGACASASIDNGIACDHHDILERLAREGKSASDVWNERTDCLRKKGWSYGERWSYEAKQAPYIVNFDELPVNIQELHIKQTQFIDNFGIQLRSKEAVEQEWANAWITE